MKNIISKRYYFLAFSGVLVVLSVIAVFALGFREGTDLAGGTQWQFSVGRSVSELEIRDAFTRVSGEEIAFVKRADDGSFIARLPSITQEEKARYEEELVRSFESLAEKNFSNIGPSIGNELRKKSLIAMVAVLFGISLYIAFAFRKVSRPVSSWKYGIVTLLTLFHDIAIPSGLLAVLGWLHGVEIDTNFIVALLVVMGFSVHDTIVVFDRIRENIVLSRGKNMSLRDVVDRSIKETFVRSVNTSLTLFIVLVALLFFGPPSLFYFILTMLVGTFFGAYSSIFVASPLLYEWHRLRSGE